MHSDLIEDIHGTDAQRKAAATRDAGWEGRSKREFEKRSTPDYAHLRHEARAERYEPLDKEVAKVIPKPEARSFGGEFRSYQWEQRHVLGQIGKNALHAMGPVAAIADAVGYTANKSEAEAKLNGLMGKDSALKLSPEAIAEYGDIVAKLRLEQGVTLGLSEAMGFSSFVDWGKKNNISVEEHIGGSARKA